MAKRIRQNRKNVETVDMTKFRNRRIATLAGFGVGFDTIGQVCQVSASEARAIARDMGVSTKGPIAKECKGAARDAQILEMARNGMTYAQIARHFGITEQYAGKLARKCGFSRRGNRRISDMGTMKFGPISARMRAELDANILDVLGDELPVTYDASGEILIG